MDRKKLEQVKTELARMQQRIIALDNAAPEGYPTIWSPKETGAVRRASMDLTRALADLRRGRP